MTRSELETADWAEVVVERFENTESMKACWAVLSSECFLRAIRVRDFCMIERLNEREGGVSLGSELMVVGEGEGRDHEKGAREIAGPPLVIAHRGIYHK